MRPASMLTVLSIILGLWINAGDLMATEAEIARIVALAGDVTVVKASQNPAGAPAPHTAQV